MMTTYQLHQVRKENWIKSQSVLPFVSFNNISTKHLIHTFSVQQSAYRKTDNNMLMTFSDGSGLL
jgi:hypothetical protein